MLESLPVTLIVSSILGVLAGLGIGGGSVLILWLTAILGMGQDIARGINLLFFLPAAAVSCIFRWKQGTLDLKTVLPAILAGVASAIGFSYIGSRVSTDLLRMPFGILLLITGLREIFYRPRKPK